MKKYFYKFSLIMPILLIMLFCCSCAKDQNATKNIDVIGDSTPNAFSTSVKNEEIENSVTYKTESSYLKKKESSDGRCILSHCDRVLPSDKKYYCGTHGCCTDGCQNKKDPMVQYCEEHSCAVPGCYSHPYTAQNSKYCKIHY